jgi:hypothetical protein
MIKCRNYGDIFPLTPAEICKIMSHVELDENGCWNWIGGTKESGYGTVGLRGAMWAVHRIIYELFVGPIPEGYVIDHKCRNKRCCNPAHLEAVPQLINARRAIAHRAAKLVRATHCKRGHALVGENLITFEYKGRIVRTCRTCRRAGARRHKERVREARRAQSAGETSAVMSSGSDLVSDRDVGAVGGWVGRAEAPSGEEREGFTQRRRERREQQRP